MPGDTRLRTTRKDTETPATQPLNQPKQRVRQTGLAVATLALPAFAALGLWFSSPGAAPTQAAPTPGPLPDLEAALPDGPLSILQPSSVETIEAEAVPAPIGQEITIRAGDTLAQLLRTAGVDRDEAQQALTALSDVFNPRRLQPGQSIRVALAPQGEKPDGDSAGQPLRLVSLSFQPSAERDIRVVRNDSVENFIATAIDRLPNGETFAPGRLSASPLLTAGQRAGVPTPAMIDLIRAFSYDVDFQREIHAAEDFELLYENPLGAQASLTGGGEVIYAALDLSGGRMELYHFTPQGKAADYFDADGVSVRRALLRTPVEGAQLSSGFGMRKHPILGYSKMHRGVDFAAPNGTPIFAAGDGEVSAAGRHGAYGHYLRLSHADGYETAYAHLSRYAPGIAPGRRVTQGQIIGYVGSTGRATGAHLHYEVMLDSKQIDPATLKLPRTDRLSGSDLAAFTAAKARIDRLRNAPPAQLQMVQRDCAGSADADGSALRFHLEGNDC